MSREPIDLGSVVRDVDRELSSLGDTSSSDEGYYRAELLSLRAAALPSD
jgi:hypothetical protein